MADQNTPSRQHTGQPLGNVLHFDDRTALHLTQAFAQEVDLQPLLDLLFAQLQATGNVRGMQYAYDPLRIDHNYGARERHTADYDLSFRDLQLGKLILYFAEPQHEQSMQTCEDLIALAFPSLRNVVTIAALRNGAAGAASSEPKKTAASVALLRKEEKSDALILLALDDYSAIRTRDGEEWAQILMSSVHEQVREGLRTADGVYHIGDDLIAVLLPQTTGRQAEEVARKVRTLVASLHLRGGSVSQQLTACMGLSDARGAGTAEDVMEQAKRALAQAQNEGVNQISIYKPTPAEHAQRAS